MQVTERMIEAAEAAVAKERDTEIARIRADLREQGEDVCVVCDEPIDAARKAAMPSAERCIGCQLQHEREMRGSRHC